MTTASAVAVESPIAIEVPAEADPAPAPAETAPVDEDDSLPAVGRVWEGGSQSLTMMFKKSNTPRPAAAEPSAAPVDNGEFSGLMGRLISALEEKGPSWPAFVKSATITGIDDGVVTLRYPPTEEMTLKMLDRNGKKETIQQLLSELMGRPIGIRTVLDPNAPADEPAAVQTAAAPSRKPSFSQASKAAAPPPPPAAETGIRLTQELKDQLKLDPLIAAVIKELGGEIVKVEEGEGTK